MGWVMDLLQEAPLSAVMKERVNLIQQKLDSAVDENELLKRRVAELEKENATLSAMVPSAPTSDLQPDTVRVLTYLFSAEGEDTDVAVMANKLGMEKGMAKYHLGCLEDVGFASLGGLNYMTGRSYWHLKPAGRQHAVEKKLV